MDLLLLKQKQLALITISYGTTRRRNDNDNALHIPHNLVKREMSVWRKKERKKESERTKPENL